MNDLINFFPASGDGAAYDNVRIAIVNDGVYAYNSPVAEFVKDKNIYASTADIGDARYTDFLQIFNTILSRGASDEVSVLVSDMIYSPRDTRNVSSEKIFNEVNSLATGVFRQYPGKSVIVTKVRGSYHGMYYPYNGAAYRYDGMRPFYVVMIADSGVIDRMCADGSFGRFLEVTGAEATYRFNQPQSDVAVAMLPSWDVCAPGATCSGASKTNKLQLDQIQLRKKHPRGAKKRKNIYEKNHIHYNGFNYALFLRERENDSSTGRRGAGRSNRRIECE